MGKTYDHIPEPLIQWIAKQEMFWVATAPLSSSGHINVSPKGLRGAFHIEGPNNVWYNDNTGSGCETIAHVRENQRITFLFSAFQGTPKSVRLYGTGVVHEFDTPQYNALIPPNKRLPGSRSVIVVNIHRVATSCGWGVPFYKFEGHRRMLLDYSQKFEKHDLAFDAAPHAEGEKPVKGLKAFWDKCNRISIDGLCALQTCPDAVRSLTALELDPVALGVRELSETSLSTGAAPRGLSWGKFVFGALVGSLTTLVIRYAFDHHI